MSLSKTQLYVVATACLVYFYQGYVHAIFNGLITMESFLARFPETDVLIGSESEKKTASLMQGTVVAILDVGSAAGSLLCSWLGDKFGRRKLVHITVVIALIGVIIQVSSFSYAQLIVGRVLAGVGLGAFSATVPMWLSECLEAHNRGKITIFTGVFVTFGFVIAAVVDLGFYYIDQSEISWRLPLALQIIPLIAIMALCFGACESPRWLVKQDSICEAISVLSQLKGMSEDEDSIHEEIVAIQNASKKEEDKNLPSTKTGYRAFLAIWLCILVTMSGINAISFFSTEMFQTQLSFTHEKSCVMSLGLQLVQLCSAFGSCFLVEFLGRRRTMMISAGSLAVTMGCLGAVGRSETQACKALGVFFQFLTMVAYPIGFHSTPYMYCAEIAPLLSRHMITSTSSAAHWLFNFIVAEITPIAFENIHSSYYFIYMSVNVCTLVCLYFIYPETKGFRLEAIDDLFMASDNPLRIVTISQQTPEHAKSQVSILSSDSFDSENQKPRRASTSSRTSPEQV